MQRHQAAAAAKAAAAAAGSSDGARAAKRPHIEQQPAMATGQILQPQQPQAQQQQLPQPVQGADSAFSITVMNQPGATINLKVKSCARLCSIMSATNTSSCRTTVRELGMQQGEMIHIMLKQQGC